MSASASGSGSCSTPLIGITGATGQLGRLVVSQLVKYVPADSIVALVRSPDKATDLGVKAREADYTKPATLVKALEGVHTLLLISSNALGQCVVQHTNVIDAAKKTGVQHLVFTSILRAAQSPLGFAKEAAETEVILRNSGLPYTILRNSWYNENYVGFIPGAINAGVWVGASGEGKISGAARRDYAEAAVAVLANPREHINATYELAGDEWFTQAQVATELSRLTGKNIPYRDLSVEVYTGILVKAGLPEPFARVVAQDDFISRNDALYDDSRTLSTLIGRPTTSLATTIKEAIKP